MNNKEKLLAAEMLRLAENEFSNHGCNEVEESVWDNWTIAERQEFVKEFHEYNGDYEEYDPNFLHLSNTSIMGFLAHKLTENI